MVINKREMVVGISNLF